MKFQANRIKQPKQSIIIIRFLFDLSYFAATFFHMASSEIELRAHQKCPYTCVPWTQWMGILDSHMDSPILGSDHVLKAFVFTKRAQINLP